MWRSGGDQAEIRRRSGGDQAEIRRILGGYQVVDPAEIRWWRSGRDRHLHAEQRLASDADARRDDAEGARAVLAQPRHEAREAKLRYGEIWGDMEIC